MSKSKAKGTFFESLIAEDQRANGFPVDRLPLKGAKDIGDLTPLYDSVQELKNTSRLQLGVWLNELEAEQKNLGVDRGWIVHKRKGKGKASEQMVTMLHSTLMSLLKEIK